MAGELPWAPPTDHVVVGRRWKYAPPPWVMYEAVVSHHGRWLILLTGETAPVVRDSQRPDAVLLQPWTNPAVIAVELRIEPDELSGSVIRVLAYGDTPQLPDETRRAVRYRLGTLFGAALREWVDEPHW
jgi:hypothetical protein